MFQRDMSELIFNYPKSSIPFSNNFILKLVCLTSLPPEHNFTNKFGAEVFGQL